MTFNRWTFAWSKKNVNEFYIKPNKVGTKFSEKEIEIIKNWLFNLDFKLEVISEKNTVIKVNWINYNVKKADELDNILNENCYLKIEREKKEKEKEEKEEKIKSLNNKIAQRPSFYFIQNVYKLKGVNSYNINALQDYLEGVTTDFKGMLNNKWLEPSQQLGLVEGGNLNFDKLKKLYEQTKSNY